MKTKVNITKENNLSYIHMGPTYSTYLRNKILLKKLDQLLIPRKINGSINQGGIITGE